LKKRGEGEGARNGSEIIGGIVGFNRQIPAKLPTSLPFELKPVV
jgi:hypothetical protein